MYSVRKHINEYPDASLEICVKRLLEILDIKEDSDSGNVFNPVYISCCRVILGMELGDILVRMKELVSDRETTVI
jgi:hypothetical protein